MRKSRLTIAVGPAAALAAAVLAALLVVGSSGGPAQAAEPQPTPSATAGSGELIRFTLPYLQHRVTDPNAVDLAQHASKAGAPLLLFLPATGAVPSDYRAFLAAASSVGYSVLGLDYFNLGRSVTRTCGPDASCYTKLQQNRFNGADPSRFSRVDAANSILHRLRSALQYLQQKDPAGDWQRFLTTDSVHWKDIVLAGHSQGGGESAFISHYHRVRGVLMFSSPVETYDDISASWIGTPGKTAASKLYGFDDVDDMYYDRIVDSWQRLGMGSADRSAAVGVPSGGSHVLLSSLYVGTPRESHGRSVSDGGPRDKGGLPTFRPGWTWMLRQLY